MYLCCELHDLLYIECRSVTIDIMFICVPCVLSTGRHWSFIGTCTTPYDSMDSCSKMHILKAVPANAMYHKQLYSFICVQHFNLVLMLFECLLIPNH